MTPAGRWLRRALVIAAAFVAAGCAQRDTRPSTVGLPSSPWVSRAVPEAAGEVKTLPDGRRQAVRYRGWSTEDFGRFRTYAYDDQRPDLSPAKAAMPAIATGRSAKRHVFFAAKRDSAVAAVAGFDVNLSGVEEHHCLSRVNLPAA